MVNIGHTQLHTYPFEGVERMTDRRGPGARNLRWFVVGITSSALQVKRCQACGKSDGRNWGFTRGSDHASYAPAQSWRHSLSPEPALTRADFGLFARLEPCLLPSFVDAFDIAGPTPKVKAIFTKVAHLMPKRGQTDGITGTTEPRRECN